MILFLYYSTVKFSQLLKFYLTNHRHTIVLLDYIVYDDTILLSIEPMMIIDAMIIIKKKKN